mmetsp:Transcript_34100/g.101412  ORF Transcript_34100/g.101412 Transcript_34100/m.101412 type:complete len:259 (+) Transcript_34100:122-898(+)
MSSAMQKSTRARTMACACRSRGVFCRFTMMNLPPALRVMSGSSLAGAICRLVPSTKLTAAWSAHSIASSSSSSGSLESQSSVLSCSGAPQPGCVHVRPVGLKPTVSTSKSRAYSRRHTWQRSAKQLPCSSARRCRGTPLRRCKLSTFWLHTFVSLPHWSSPTSAMCVKLGMAYSKRTFMGGTGSFFARRVQMPAGPLKSGIPTAVDMPAPVKATTFAPSADTSPATCFIFLTTSSTLSKYSVAPSCPPTFFLRLSLSA